MTKCLSPIFLLLFFLVFAGCGTANSVAVTDPPKSATKPVISKTEVTEKEVAAPAGRTELVATAADGTAEAAFQQTLIAFQEGRLDAAYDFLPASFQADLQSLVHTFAAKMDADLWAKCFNLMAKISSILKSKKTLILNLDNVKNSSLVESLKPRWDAIADGLHDVAYSHISNVSVLKTIDVRHLIASGGDLLRELPLPKFGDVTVSTIEADGDTAILSYRESNDTDPKRVEFVKVEGKWLPKSIATGWPAGIADAKGKIDALPEQIATFKVTVMQKLDEIGGMLDQVQQAKTAEEFSKAIVPLIFAAKFGALLAQQAIQDASERPRKGTPIHIVVERELSDSEQTKLKDAVIATTGDDEMDYEFIPSDGKTRCRFTPVSDSEAIVTMLRKHFSGASIRWNLSTKTIHVELK